MLVYVSSTTCLQDSTMLRKYVLELKRQCETYHATGLLIYSAGNYLRFIEGDYDSVQMVYQLERMAEPDVDFIKLYGGADRYLYFQNYPMGAHILETNELKDLGDFQSQEMREYLDECTSINDAPMSLVKKFIEYNGLMRSLSAQ
ncbi:MAG: hypothetical protein JWN56_618 [Sphingobacteriales bacterium]|nr:hypothetical protein [Sphingobacteriales bacterium]